MARKLPILVGVLAISSAAKAAVVTYTLSLNESLTCGAQTGRFNVWVTVEPATSAGLFAFGVDLKGTAEPGGPAGMTLVNRSPNGKFDADPGDPNYHPEEIYPTKYFGFGTGRGASASTGIVSGVQDLAKGSDLIPLFGFGQSPGAANNLRPPPDLSTGVPVAYANATADAGTDAVWPPPTCTPAGLPLGTARLASGTWTGGVSPSFDTGSVNNKASVWKLSHPNNTENELATLQFQTRIVDFPPLFQLTGTALSTNRAVGGAIAVNGSNNSYVSEVDQLTEPPATNGSAPIQTIGDEAGNVYVMAKLTGTQAEIEAMLSQTTADVDASDPQFGPLHAAYDAQFGGGGFNALFRFSNIAGTKVFNWDISGNAVAIDQLAVVPEPTSIGAVSLAMGALLRRRRR